MDIDIDMDLNYNIEEVIKDLSEINMFSDQDEYMKLHEASINVSELLNISEVLELLNNTYKRYKRYLNIIEFTDDSIYIKKDIIRFIKKYHNNTNENELINIMERIDSFILDTIHKNNEAVFWLGKM